MTMDDRFKLDKPDEGLQTLVGQFSVLRVDHTIAKAQEMRNREKPKEEIQAFIAESHPNLDPGSLRKIYRLSLGLSPRNDFEPHDVAEERKTDESSREVRLEEPQPDLQEGGLVFYKGQRWVLTSLRGKTLTLKRI